MIMTVMYPGTTVTFSAMFGNGAGTANGGVLQVSGTPCDKPSEKMHEYIFLPAYRNSIEPKLDSSVVPMRLRIRGGPTGGIGFGPLILLLMSIAIP